MVDSLEAEKIVLENWKKERAQLDAAIMMLESKIGARNMGISGLPAVSSVGHIAPDTFFRMTVQEAIKKFLKMVGKPARPATDVVDALNRGGLSVAYPTVYTSLTRLRSKHEVVKAGENWGLDEWYPPASSKIRSATEAMPDILGPGEAAGAPQEQKAGVGQEIHQSAAIKKGKTRKDMVAEFIKTHGPSTRSEILAGTDVPDGTIAYCLHDETRFVRGEDEKWRNVE